MRARAARIRLRRYKRVCRSEERPDRHASAAEGHGYGSTISDETHDADVQSPQAANRVPEPSAAHSSSVRSKPKTLPTEIRAFFEQP